MTNILKRLGIGVADFGKWFAGGVADTVKLSAKIETVLSAAKPLEAPFIAGLASVVTDVKALIAASTAAVSADGLNFPADSKAYQEFLTLLADFRKLAPIVTEAIQLLEGKAPKPPSAAVKTDRKRPAPARAEIRSQLGESSGGYTVLLISRIL